MSTKGIDISHWQGTVDFEKVKAAGYSFVIIKAGGADSGYYKDKCFESFYQGAKAAGLNVGAYYFNSAKFYTADQGKIEAQQFLNLIKGKQFEYPVCADIEAVATSRGKENITDAAIAFCQTLENAGYYVSIYASDVSGFKDRLNISRLESYDKWVAKYSSSGPSYVKSYGMWQFGGGVNYRNDVKVPGVASAACDQDEAFIDYPTIIKAAGLNGFTRATAAAPAAAAAAPAETITITGATEANKTVIKTICDALGVKYSIQ